MHQLRANVTATLNKSMPEHFFHKDHISVVHQGRFANALLFRYRDKSHDLIIKDYSHCPRIIKGTAGRLFIAREHKALRQLHGIDGIASASHKLSKVMLAYPYIKGKTLNEIKSMGKTLPAAFFHKMEKLVREMHARGVLHLDLRNLGNVICGANHQPYFIDFQSALRLDHLPSRLSSLLRATDLSGVYKSWIALCDEPLSPSKHRFLESYNKIRKLWIFRGYPSFRFALKEQNHHS